MTMIAQERHCQQSTPAPRVTITRLTLVPTPASGGGRKEGRKKNKKKQKKKKKTKKKMKTKMKKNKRKNEIECCSMSY